MEKTVFDDYVKSRYYDQMNYYDRTAVKNQKRYKLFQWILIVLSAATPVLAALMDKDKFADLKILVVIISAIVAILTTGLKTFNYQELWITYRTTYEKLKPELYYYNFDIGPYAANGMDKESLFVTRVETILDAEHTQWPPAKKLQENQDKAKKQPAGNASADTEIADNDNSGVNVIQPETANSPDKTH